MLDDKYGRICRLIEASALGCASICQIGGMERLSEEEIKQVITYKRYRISFVKLAPGIYGLSAKKPSPEDLALPLLKRIQGGFLLFNTLVQEYDHDRNLIHHILQTSSSQKYFQTKKSDGCPILYTCSPEGIALLSAQEVS
jgi:hypothetical protein